MVPIIVHVNQSKPSVEISIPSSPISFSISILSLNEKNSRGESVERISLDETMNLTSSLTSSTSNIWIYNSTLSNSAIMTITVSLFVFIIHFNYFFFNGFKFIQFTQTTDYIVHNETQQFSSNSLKFNIRIENWNFKSLANTLDIEFENNVQGVPNNNNNNNECEPTNNSHIVAGRLQWWEITFNGTSLYPFIYFILLLLYKFSFT